ncbi:RNA polymerase sigma factor [Paenibacillus sp. FSL R7-0273]|uniref:sigma-70 family RNA polymerase sigma factor n=1 Tax=Paenibacillus sp. FSL R7-0273 TaxID=1536772 RepID=UPI0004F912EF|nr:sigma-70 family RNA polymerase sigma factor [Paenibacillus sp. FSL R7-0273]AIQ45400.1 RNA polymerase sigma factor [Paenibacillus sp. FSL R7-0273]OMF89972.1 RNA polymerase subunit sigma [Paenibacillus sp. FSL R7-0273]
MKHPMEYAQLIEQTLAGSVEAYGELYEATIRDVYRTVRFLVSEPVNAEDIVQEVYVELYRSLGRYDHSREFRPWLTGLVMRQIQAYRRRGWRHFRLLRRAEQTAERMEHDFAGEVVDRISNRALLMAVNHLPFKLKQVVILHYLQEYSQEEIAAILEIPLGTVKSRIHAALQKLRRKHQADTIQYRRVEDVHES